MKNPIFSIRDYWNRNITRPLFASFVVLIISLIGIVIFDLIKQPWTGKSFWDNIDSEIHGVFLDIIVVVLIYNAINYLTDKKREKERIETEKKQRIERYLEELEDYRGWKEPEAAFRIAGIIKRLDREGVHELHLDACFLKGTDLRNLNLTSSYMINSNFDEANLINTRFNSSSLLSSTFIQAFGANASFENANLMGANFQSAILEYANFRSARLSSVIFSDAKLNNSILDGAYMRYVNLERAYLYEVSLSDVDLEGANLTHAQVEIIQLAKVKSLKDAIMMDGSRYNEKWAKWIAEGLEPELLE